MGAATKRNAVLAGSAAPLLSASIAAFGDGSAGWDFKTKRDGDRVTIPFGPETYVVVDVLIHGG